MEATTTYSTLASFAQVWGTIFFVLLFLGALIYALRPSKSAEFKHAAMLPFSDDEKEDL